ncbi:Yap1801 protein [Pichia kluyveri]|uniref:Yap1801 protein n=1 Tax=Pichia kluyveri TaxID=36015 RepID=A0AAV5QYL7_PICKL|nr:Yap1801 protein [Pichia kluyveri]
MTTFEKLVDGATKIKLAPPKPKYVEPILMTTSEGERSESFRTVMRALNKRLQDSAWTIVYKSLILIHIMIREGDGNVCLTYLSNHLNILNVKIGNGGKFISNGGDLNQIYTYDNYLLTRSKEFLKTNHDFIKESKKPYGSWNSNEKSTLLRDLTIDKGLLRITESIQNQIDALLRCKFRESEVNNDLVILSFRMLTTDLITLYQCLNEGILNILEHFFDLSKIDAERAFTIYEHFTKETKKVIEFLRIAKHLESLTKLRVPTIKHAQTSLTESLKDYLQDPDFEINRRQYLAEKEIGKSNSPIKKFDNVSKTGQEPALKQPVFEQQQLEQQALQQQQQQQQQALQQQAIQQQAIQQQALQAQALQAQALQAQELQAQALQAQATANAITNNATGIVQQTTGFNPFTNMNTFSVQPIQNNVQVPLPQAQVQVQHQPQPQFTSQMINNMGSTIPLNLQTPTENNNSFISNPLLQPRVLSNNFTGNGFGNVNNNVNNSNINNSPIRSASVTSSNNPFSNSRFSTTSTTTAFTNQKDQESNFNRNSFIKPTYTGTNPFRLETGVNNNNINSNSTLSTVNEIRPQVTAGGLERLPTIPVFPETQQQMYKESLQQQAKNNLNQGVINTTIANNPFSQQVTGMVQQAQNQNQFTGQNQGQFQNQFTGQAPNQFTGQIQNFSPNPNQFQFQQGYNNNNNNNDNNVYNGPNLLG